MCCTPIYLTILVLIKYEAMIMMDISYLCFMCGKIQFSIRQFVWTESQYMIYEDNTTSTCSNENVSSSITSVIHRELLQTISIILILLVLAFLQYSIYLVGTIESHIEKLNNSFGAHSCLLFSSFPSTHHCASIWLDLSIW